jgi:hypothetical protein
MAQTTYKFNALFYLYTKRRAYLFASVLCSFSLVSSSHSSPADQHEIMQQIFQPLYALVFSSLG